MRKLYVEPQAEAVVAKLYEQHKAAQRFIRDNMAGQNGASTPSYFPGELKFTSPKGGLKPYLPFGFKDQSGDYATLIYCLDKDSMASSLDKEMSGCSASGAESCCGKTNSVTYLATFGCVPQKWRNIRTGRPNNDLLNAIQNVVGLGTDMGYADFVEKDAEGNGLKSTMMIRGREVTFVSIPQFIISKKLTGQGAFAVTAGRSFNEMCGDGVKDEEVGSEAGAETVYDEETGEPVDGSDVVAASKCKYCLIYLTPFD